MVAYYIKLSISDKYITNNFKLLWWPTDIDTSSPVCHWSGVQSSTLDFYLFKTNVPYHRKKIVLVWNVSEFFEDLECVYGNLYVSVNVYGTIWSSICDGNIPVQYKSVTEVNEGLIMHLSKITTNVSSKLTFSSVAIGKFPARFSRSSNRHLKTCHSTYKNYMCTF